MAKTVTPMILIYDWDHDGLLKNVIVKFVNLTLIA